jgi:glutamate dehydrogenase/leucine dehydrogenase
MPHETTDGSRGGADAVGPFRFIDALGPEKTVEIYEPRIGLKAVVVIDNVACGPAIGGIRMAPDVSVEECVRLARAMTLKSAAAGLAHGGGKSVIFGDPRMTPAEKERTIRAFARAIRDLSDYIPGPDMGTDEQSMAWTKDEIGRAVGLPSEIGGIPLDVVGATGFGLCAAVDVAKEFCNLTLSGARVAVQGFGAVGKHAARFLAESGAVLVAASDSTGTLIDRNGIDVPRLIAHKDAGRSVIEFAVGEKFGTDAIIDVDCDIWIPAARPDVLHAGNAGRLKAKLVPQGANIPATAEAEAILHERHILVIPDFIANAGGVICAAAEYHGGTQASAFATIDERIRVNTRQVLENARKSAQRPREAAVDLAYRRVRQAMTYRRA